MSSRIYLGTRSFALKGTLLDRSSIEKLAESSTLEELANRLRATPYSDAVSRVNPPITARKLELALRERLAQVHYSLMSAAGKYDILKLYYDRYISWNLKSALKSRALGRPQEESSSFIDLKAEELVGRRDLIVRVLAAKDIQEATSLLSGTDFHVDAEKALASYTARGEVRFFDVYIDHTVLSSIARTYSRNRKQYASRAVDVGGIGDVVASDIDSYNALSVLRSKLWGLPETEITDLVITPTYRVTSAMLARMVGAESTEAAVKQLDQVVSVASSGQAGDEQLIDSVEVAFRRRMRGIISKSFTWQGIGPANALALIKLLEFEVNNLAAVAIGVEAHMNPTDVLAKLTT